MSTDEMRKYCQSISPYQLRVQVRLKSAHEVLTGKITGVEGECFQLVTDDQDVKMLNYAWVARISNA